MAQHPQQSSATLSEALNLLCPTMATQDVAASIPFELERQVAAWVLLTRLADEDLQTAWSRHGPVLQRFAVETLLSNSNSIDSIDKSSTSTGNGNKRDDDDTQMLQRYLRLVSQVTLRLTPELYPTEIVGEAIVRAWKSVDHAPLSAHLDVCSSLEVFLLADPARANAASVLQVIWNRYSSFYDHDGQAISSSATSEQDGDKSSTHLDDRGGEDEDEDEDGGDWSIMGDTIDKILATSSPPNSQDSSDDDSTFYSLTAWNELILGIFTQEGIEDLIPATIVPSLLEWIAHPPSSLDKALHAAWNAWFLTWITTRSRISTSSSALNQQHNLLHQVLLQQPDAVSRLQRILLSHVISPESSSSNKDNSVSRALAWQALVALVDTNGWDWMVRHNDYNTAAKTMTQPPTMSGQQKLGQATLLCTWIRLAGGELRIQLQLLVSTTSEESPEGSFVHSTLGGRQATGLLIGLACGQLLQSVVQYLIEIADQPHIPTPLSGDALLHLRQSLEQALWTAVEYLSLTTVVAPKSNTDTGTTTSNVDRASLFHSLLRLLGTLLMEIDIFDLLEKNVPFVDDEDADDKNKQQQHDASSPPMVILTCLKGILPVAEDPSLLPGLVHILGDAEGDMVKEELLLEYVHAPLLVYLEWYWQRGSISTTLELLDDTVSWACSCTELWVQLSVSAEDRGRATSSVATAERRRLCLALLAWIQQILQTNNPGSRNYLSLALGCYMTLSKDRVQPPKEHENRVILRALQRCDMS